MEPPHNDDLLPDAELARWLDVHEDTPAQWRHRKEGPPYIRIGRKVRYLRGDVQRWLEAQRVTPGAA